jgi:hypothetical protein
MPMENHTSVRMLYHLNWKLSIAFKRWRYLIKPEFVAETFPQRKRGWDQRQRENRRRAGGSEEAHTEGRTSCGE